MPSAPIEPQARFDVTIKRPTRRLSPAEKAGRLVAFCRANPDLWPTIQREAKTQAREHGRVSIPAIFSAQRWAHLVNADASPYKLNNDFSPLFARMLAFKFPELSPLIEIRRSGYDNLAIEVVLQLVETPNYGPER